MILQKKKVVVNTHRRKKRSREELLALLNKHKKPHVSEDAPQHEAKVLDRNTDEYKKQLYAAMRTADVKTCRGCASPRMKIEFDPSEWGKKRSSPHRRCLACVKN